MIWFYRKNDRSYDSLIYPPKNALFLFVNFPTEYPLRLCGLDLPTKDVMEDSGVCAMTDLNCE